jgi:hypothetical protein
MGFTCLVEGVELELEVEWRRGGSFIKGKVFSRRDAWRRNLVSIIIKVL